MFNSITYRMKSIIDLYIYLFVRQSNRDTHGNTRRSSICQFTRQMPIISQGQNKLKKVKNSTRTTTLIVGIQILKPSSLFSRSISRKLDWKWRALRLYPGIYGAMYISSSNASSTCMKTMPVPTSHCEDFALYSLQAPIQIQRTGLIIISPKGNFP